MTMPAMGPMLPNGPAAREPDLLQFEAGDAGGDVQPGLALHADRLQRVGFLRPANKKMPPPADTHGSIGADAAITAGELAASDPAGRRIHRPGKLGLLGDANIQAEAAHGGGGRRGTASFALEHAFEAGYGTNDEADILAALALQDAGALRRHRVGAGNGRGKCCDGDSECGKSHMSVSPDDELNSRGDRRKAPCRKQGASKNSPSKHHLFDGEILQT